MKNCSKYLFIVLVFLGSVVFSQNETKKWYFGNYAGLDFMTAPPTILTGTMNAFEGCASVANTLGNLLFYTDGVTIWNQAHAVMANGTGLQGNISTTQSSLIVKQPGNSNIYFVFTNDALGGMNGLRYSVVDMSLASGQGSVTVLNTLLVTPCTEKLSAVRHCNGIDVWVMVHDVSSNNFRAFLVSSTGVNSVAVVSAVGSSNVGLVGYMKFSPNGKKLALGVYATAVELYDFNSSTGIVSNSLSISPVAAYGCEFSADNTKLYAGSGNKIHQWDLCAGSATAIVASEYTVAASNTYAMQLASNGKIYVARQTQQTLGVINNPNTPGSGCNYVDLGQSVSPNFGVLGLPNFVTSSLKQPPPPFTYTVSNLYGCQGVGFTSPMTAINTSVANCPAMGYSVSGQVWNFGDPVSGSSNTSTTNNPVHLYSFPGNYTVQVVLYYNCGTDTVRQAVFVNQPCVSVNSTSITCYTLGSATVNAFTGTGPYFYTWMPSGQTGSVATGLSPGTYSIIIFDFGTNSSFSTSTIFSPLIPFTGTLSSSPSVACNGVSTATAGYTNFSGGTGNQTYLWTNGLQTYTTALASGLGAGSWSSTVTDALTGCSVNHTFNITQPPAITALISANTLTACAGTNIVLTSTTTGGIGALSYNWGSGPPTPGFTANVSLAGTYIYTLVITDANACVGSKTIALNFIPNPTVSVANVSVCPLQTGILTANGATTYTWSNNTSGNTFTNNPVNTTQYSVTGSALGCTAAATASIVLKPVPTAVIATNSPLCAGVNLLLNGSGGLAYSWAGPANFNSSIQNPVISQAGSINSGVYNLTVTAANSCTSSTNATVIINPNPNLTLSLSTTSICAQGSNGSPNTVILNASGATSYTISVPANINNSNPSGFTTTLSLLPPSNYSGVSTLTLSASNGSCTSGLTSTFIIVPNPTVAISNYSPVICAGQNFTYTTTGASSYTWSSANPGNTIYVTGSVAVVNPTITSLFSLIGYSLGCISETQTSTLTVNPLPPLVLSANRNLICVGESATLTASGAQNYSWMPAGFPANPLVTITPSITSSYTVQGFDLNGCANTATIAVSVKICTGINEILVREDGFLIYPNPNSGNFIIESKIPMKLSLINSLGQLAWEINLHEKNAYRVSISEIATGVYYLISNDKSVSQKVVVGK